MSQQTPFVPISNNAPIASNASNASSSSLQATTTKNASTSSLSGSVIIPMAIPSLQERLAFSQGKPVKSKTLFLNILYGVLTWLTVTLAFAIPAVVILFWWDKDLGGLDVLKGEMPEDKYSIYEALRYTYDSEHKQWVLDYNLNVEIVRLSVFAVLGSLFYGVLWAMHSLFWKITYHAYRLFKGQ